MQAEKMRNALPAGAYVGTYIVYICGWVAAAAVTVTETVTVTSRMKDERRRAARDNNRQTAVTLTGG